MANNRKYLSDLRHAVSTTNPSEKTSSIQSALQDIRQNQANQVNSAAMLRNILTIHGVENILLANDKIALNALFSSLRIQGMIDGKNSDLYTVLGVTQSMSSQDVQKLLNKVCFLLGIKPSDPKSISELTTPHALQTWKNGLSSQSATTFADPISTPIGKVSSPLISPKQILQQDRSTKYAEYLESSGYRPLGYHILNENTAKAYLQKNFPGLTIPYIIHNKVLYLSIPHTATTVPSSNSSMQTIFARMLDSLFNGEKTQHTQKITQEAINTHNNGRSPIISYSQFQK